MAIVSSRKMTSTEILVDVEVSKLEEMANELGLEVFDVDVEFMGFIWHGTIHFVDTDTKVVVRYEEGILKYYAVYDKGIFLDSQRFDDVLKMFKYVKTCC